MFSKIMCMAGLVAISGASQALMVDDFVRPYTNTIGSVSTYVAVMSPPPGVILTGERDIEMAITANPFNQFMDLSIGGGFHVVSNGFGTDGTTKLQYDGVGDEIGNLGLGNTLTNSGMGVGIFNAGDNRIRLNWVGNDLDVVVSVQLRSSGTLLATNTQTRFGGSGVGVQNFNFALATMASADSLTIVFDPIASGDFALASIESVPEPATLAILGFGVAALARRRRK